MKTLFIFPLLLVFAQLTWAQKERTEPRQILFQLTTSDTLAHKALMKQVNNILSVAPDSKIEIVCHGPGIGMLQTKKTVVAPKVEEFKKKGVVFTVCEFSLKERQVSREEILPQAQYVPAGIIHIVDQENSGWTYVKAGF